MRYKGMLRAAKLLRAGYALQQDLLNAWSAPPGLAGGTYRNRAGSRHYKMYAPRTAHAGALPLVVMLHGCSQDAGELAAATRMNELAEELGFVVVYPEQPRRANASRCWNWFEALHQRRDEGEPSLIAGITRRMLREGLDRRRVYIAGLSAGGAMAAIVGAEYPELYAAIGVHSGLPRGAASDFSSALAAMSAGQGGRHDAERVPIIAFHGDRDDTVHPSNSDFTPGPGSRVAEERGERNGRSFTRTLHFDAQGRPTVEQWLVHGAGHAWCGGRAGAPFADPLGPDASREMARFFLSHAR